VIEVTISRGEGGVYRTQVVRSEAGEASAPVELDVTALTARREHLRWAVVTSAVPASADHERPLREVGRELFAALLGTGEVAGQYRASAALAANRGQELRIVVRIDDSVLAGLPWEAMYDDASGAYVCRRHQLVRHVDVASVTTPLTVDPPLRILAVDSSPQGQGDLDVAAERGQLTRALSGLVAQRRAELVWAPSATWADLQDTLLGDPWHVLHFIGHGTFEPGLDEGALALVRDDGQTDWVGASRFVDLLRQGRPIPRLVVLNSCSGATTGTDMFSSMATTLVRGGVSAVTAMQYEFTDRAAVAFTRGFYGALAHGRGVDEAVSSGRVSIIGINGNTLEWVTPVLYLRGPNSHLFTIPAPHPAGDDQQTAMTPPPGGDVTYRDSPSAAARPAHSPARLLRTLRQHTAGVRCLAFSPSGELLATAGDDHGVQLWQMPGGVHLRTITVGTRTVTGVAFSPDGQLLVTAGTGGRFLWLFDTANGTQVQKLAGHTTGVFDVAFSPVGSFLASGGSDQTVRLWALGSASQARALTGHTGTVRSVAFSSDGGLLASGGSDQTVRLWTLPSGDQAGALTGHAHPVTGLAFRPGQAVLAAAAGTTLYLWDLATGSAEVTLTGHTELVYGVAFSPRGHLVASVGADRTVRLWGASSGAELQRLTGHEAAVTGVAFSPDGHLLASAGSDDTVRLWELHQRETQVL
jgi:WD40 repeat protein